MQSWNSVERSPGPVDVTSEDRHWRWARIATALLNSLWMSSGTPIRLPPFGKPRPPLYGSQEAAFHVINPGLTRPGWRTQLPTGALPRSRSYRPLPDRRLRRRRRGFSRQQDLSMALSALKNGLRRRLVFDLLRRMHFRRALAQLVRSRLLDAATWMISSRSAMFCSSCILSEATSRSDGSRPKAGGTGRPCA